jgi:nucleotide-binding universal stress UspA family protein
VTPKLVVGIRSDDVQAEDAVALGVDLARLWNAHLVLTGAWASPLGAGDALYAGVVCSEIERELEQLRKKIPDDVFVTTEVRGSTSISRALHRAAEVHHAEMLVLGPVREELPYVGASPAHLTVIHDAPTAVAVAPAGYRAHPRDSGSVMAAWDGSDESRLALEASVGLAIAIAGTLHLVHVVETPLITLGHGVLNDSRLGEWMSGQLARGRELLASGVKAVSGRVPVRSELREGLPDAQLAEAGLGDRFIVVGSRGYGAVRRSVLGSTSAGLLARADAPVLVCPRSTPVPHVLADEPVEPAVVLG